MPEALVKGLEISNEQIKVPAFTELCLNWGGRALNKQPPLQNYIEADKSLKKKKKKE